MWEGSKERFKFISSEFVNKQKMDMFFCVQSNKDASQPERLDRLSQMDVRL